MKKLILILSLSLIVGLAFYASSANATFDQFRHGFRNNFYKNRIFNPDNQLSKAKCQNATGNPVINVTQKVRNDADSGEGGNYWAIDYYNRRIRVWATTVEGTYCAVVTYDGQFFAVPGQVGPGNDPVGALIDSPVNGRMSGGRRATIVGTLLGSPTWPVTGSVGTTNYQCNINGVCLGLVSWPDKYFEPGYSYADNWWGWQYKGGSHGTWINSLDGNSGNIL